jgi:monoamine oxidase
MSPNRLGREARAIVVGAGISGLVTARELSRAGVSVTVLEARDRVGGKMCTVEVGGDPVDLGAHWIGPGQRRIAALAHELGIETEPQHLSGRNVLVYRGRRSTFKGTIPKFSPLALLELQLGIWRLEAMRKRLSRQGSLTAETRGWDEISLGDWERRRLRTRGARMVLDLSTELVFGAEPGELSLLYFLSYMQAAGGWTALTEFEGGAQQAHFVGGSQPVCLRLADELGDGVVLEAPVQEVAQDEAGVVVRTASGSFEAELLVLAVSPALAARIRYFPPLPLARDALSQRMFMGAYMKGIASYERPWWREQGLSGLAYRDSGPVQMVVDASGASGQGTLMAFITGRAALELGRRPAEERRDAVISALVEMLGVEAARPADYLDFNWHDEPWSRGGPVGLMGPGTLAALGDALREPVGRIHWAGTETAREWIGYMEGGIEAGERASGEVLARLEHREPSMSVDREQEPAVDFAPQRGS